jgi:fibronectin type 3 domain-containing protein
MNGPGVVRKCMLALALAGVAICLVGWQAPVEAYTDLTADYTWKPVKIGGGGWDVGMWIHPTESGLVYCRSDVGGAYRWDEATDTWANVVTAGSMPTPPNGYYGQSCCGTNYSGVDSIVGASSDPDIAYMAKPREDGGQVFRSTDRGDTWVLPGNLNVAMAPNGSGRQEGERLAVDPANPDVVYYGSIDAGLWVTADGAATWSQVAQVPVGTDAAHGVNTVVFDPNSGTTGGKTNVVYVTSWGSGVYRSGDAGASWSRISGGSGPADGLGARDAEVGPDGTYYVVYTSAQQIWKYSGASWTNISPGGQSWEDIAVDPFNGHRLFCTRSGAGTFWRSTNQGANWTSISRSTWSDIDWQHTYYLGSSWMSVGEIAFDPTVADTLWFAEGFGMWRTTDLDDTEITWYSVSRGIEDTCAKDVLCPVSGKPVTAQMDLNAFYHSDPDAYTADQAHVIFSAAWSLDYCAGQPSFLAMACEAQSHNVSGYSTDAGQTWTEFATKPGDKYEVPRGIGVSATDPDNIFWYNSADNEVWYTTNRGGSWTRKTGFGTPFNVWWGPGNEAVAADKVAGGTFYFYNWSNDADGGIWRSTDGGASWSHVHASGYGWLPDRLPPTSIGCLEAAPGQAGHLWWCGGIIGDDTTGPLYRSTDYGATWTAIPNTDWARCVGFGRTADGATYPTIYYAGKVDGVEGVWRSADECQSWARVCDYPLGIYSSVTAMVGDPDVFGKVYLGLDGKGFAYGEFTGGDTTPPAAPTNLGATPVNDHRIDLDWDDNTEPDLDSYRVYRDTSPGGPYAQIASGVPTSDFADETCEASTAYYYLVTAVDTSSNESDTSNEASATTPGDTTPPANPTGLVATVVSSTKVDLDWDDNAEPDLDGYNVYRSTTPGGGYAQTAELVPASGHSDTGLTAGTTYYYVVTAVDTNSNESGYSNEASATPDAGMADANIAEASSAPTVDGAVDAVWSGATSYAMLNTLSGSAGGSDLSGAWRALWDATNLYYLVEVTDESLWNDSANAWDDDSVELYIDADNSKGTSYDGVNDYQLVFRWNDPGVIHLGTNSATDTTGMDFAIEDTPGGYTCEVLVPWATLGVTPAAGEFIGTDVHVNDDDDGGARDAKIAWYATADNSWTDPSTFGTGELLAGAGDTTPPAAPTNLSATAGDGVVDLDWDDNSEPDLDSYSVYRDTSSGGPYGQIASDVAGSDYSDSTVTNGTTYYYVVTAVDTSSNESGYSNEASATPQGDITPPAAPTNLAATGGDGVVDLDWDDNSEPDLASYSLYRDTSSGEPYGQIASGVASSDYSDSSVTNGTTYYYVVTAVDTASNESGYSNEAGATPEDTTPPAAPTNLSAIGGDGVVDLDWDDNSEPDLDSYSVYRDTSSGGPYAQIASGVGTSDYSDSTVTNGTTYYYVVTAVDTASNESGYSNEASATPQAGATTVHVDSIIVEWIQAGGPNRKGQATVVVKDNLGNAVQDATVTGTFTGTLSETQSGTTDGTGTAVIQTKSKTKNPGGLTFCVDGVTHATLDYAPGDNVETCDSV